MKDFLDECYLAFVDIAVAIHDLFTIYPVMAPLVTITTLFVTITILFI